MADNEVIIDVVAKLDKAEASLKKFEGTAKDSGNAAGLSLSTAIVAGAALAAAAIAALTLGIKKGIDEAILQEDAINDLNAALARSGQFSKEASLGMQEFAVGLQKASIFGDDTILKTATLIQSLGRLSTDGLKTATQASADLAAGLRIDLRSAALLVGKAAVGEISSFSRYGIVIKSGADNAQTFANALKAINQNFGGAAASQINTFGGRLTQANIAFGDLLEEVGNLIIKSPGVGAALGIITKAFVDMSVAVNGQQQTGIFDRIIVSILDFAQELNTYGVKAFEATINAIRNIGGVVVLVANTVKNSLDALTGSASFSNIVDQLKKDYEGLNKVANDTSFSDSITSGVQALKTAVVEAKPLAEEFKNVIQSVVPESGPFEAFLAENRLLLLANKELYIQEAINLKTFTQAQFEQLQQLTAAPLDTAKQNLLDFQANVQAAMVRSAGYANIFKAGFANAFQAVGAALVSGGNMFAAFGKAVLGMFGDLAIHMAQFYLAQALASVLAFNYAAAAGSFAAAAGLFVLGGALKALGGGGGASASSGAAASGGGGGSTAAITTQQQQPEQQQRSTAVTVNVQGNILDRRQTGLELAEAINEAFSADGVVIARGAFV